MVQPDIYVVLEILIGLIIIPWCAWVTASIFALRTQTAIMKEQLNVSHRMETVLIATLKHQRGGKDD